MSVKGCGVTRVTMSLENHVFSNLRLSHRKITKSAILKYMKTRSARDIKAGWLEMKLSPEDARKRIYKLKSPEQTVKEMEKAT